MDRLPIKAQPPNCLELAIDKGRTRLFDQVLSNYLSHQSHRIDHFFKKNYTIKEDQGKEMIKTFTPYSRINLDHVSEHVH